MYIIITSNKDVKLTVDTIRVLPEINLKANSTVKITNNSILTDNQSFKTMILSLWFSNTKRDAVIMSGINVNHKLFNHDINITSELITDFFGNDIEDTKHKFNITAADSAVVKQEKRVGIVNNTKQQLYLSLSEISPWIELPIGSKITLAIDLVNKNLNTVTYIMFSVHALECVDAIKACIDTATNCISTKISAKTKLNVVSNYLEDKKKYTYAIEAI